jgi:superfamily II DNA or RNA helicase
VTRPREQRPRFLTEADLAILRDLTWLKRTNQLPSSIDVVLGPDGASRRVLEALLATGRLRHGGLNGPLLRTGEPRRAELHWIKSDGGKQRLTFLPAHQIEGSPVFGIVLPLEPPHYVDLEAGQVGAILTELPPQLAIEVARAPVIAPSEAAHVKEVIRQQLVPRSAKSVAEPQGSSGAEPPAEHQSWEPSLLPLPEAPDDVEIRLVTPKPRLELLLTQARLKPTHVWYASEERHRGTFPLPIARLSFDYAGDVVPVHAAIETLERVEADRLVLTPRDHKAEALAGERLLKLGLKGLNSLPFNIPPAHAPDLFLTPPGNPGIYDWMVSFDDPGRYIAFSAEVLPQLAGEDWQIAFSDDYPYRLAEGAAEWWADVGQASGIDWFSFELGIAFEGHRLNLVPQLANILAELPAELIALAGQEGLDKAFAKLCRRLQLYHTLPDGRLLPLPGERLAPILKAMLELIGPRGDRLVDGSVRLHRAEAAALAGFAAGAGRDVAWAASAKRLIELGHDLRRARGVKDVKPPKTFKASLRSYQTDGLAWLDFLRGAGFGGVLADDMGLGKTVQALAFLTREKAEGRLDKPALIVSPTSVLPNWQAEAQRFAPHLRVLPLRGLDRKAQFGEIATHDLVLTTYPLLARDHDVLLGEEFHVAILDEAQAIKNPKATISRLAHRINARHRFALTGTPLENNLGEVWSLFEFLSPGLLGDEATFRRTFRTPIEKHGDAAAQGFLSRRLKPFMLRRTKGEVAKELPPKTEIVERVRLEGGQRDLYETVRALMHARVRDEIARKGLAKSHIVFLDALLKLRQICCDPRLLKMPQARKVKGSAKLERLLEMIPEMVVEGRRILLFSQFTSMLELIEPELTRREIGYAKLTGDTRDRAAPVKSFQSGEVPLFLLSLKAGGTGLNLTAADTVIHYDPWWNPAVENQATDRAYRIGQDKPVFVYKLIVEEGIEEAIELLKARKAALAEALFAGSAKTPLDLSEADISALFAPLDAKPMRRAA